MLHEFEPKKDDMNTPKKANYGFCDYLIPFDQEEEKETILLTTMSFTFGFFFEYFLFYKALILTQLVIKKRKKGRETDPRAGASPFCRASDSRTLSRLPSRPPAREGRRAKKRAGREKEDGAEEEPGGVPPEGDEPTGHKDESQ